MTLKFLIPAVNPPKLIAELQAGLGGLFQDISTGPVADNQYFVVVGLADAATKTDQDNAAAIVAAHNPTAKTDDQAVAEASDQALKALLSTAKDDLAWLTSKEPGDQRMATILAHVVAVLIGRA